MKSIFAIIHVPPLFSTVSGNVKSIVANCDVCARTVARTWIRVPGAGLTHQFLVIGLSVTIFLSAGIAALITHEFQSHGITNHVNVPNPWGQ